MPTIEEVEATSDRPIAFVTAGGKGKRRGAWQARPLSSRCGEVELRGDQNAVAVSDDLAARDLGLVGDHRVQLLVANPAGDDLRRLLALLRSLEEAE
jgi:hypothetical protein